MTQIVDILGEFFSPFSKERVWVMKDSDNYTQIVRNWWVVKDAVSKVKDKLSIALPEFEAYSQWPEGNEWEITTQAWQPTLTNSALAVNFGKPGNYLHIPKPPGTDPSDCMVALGVYLSTRTANTLAMAGSRAAPGVQLDKLYTSSIGSFSLYATLDSYDSKGNTATINFWMFNAMTRKSFGKYAHHTVFSQSGMQAQYLWWNWTEAVDWNSGFLRTVAGWR